MKKELTYDEALDELIETTDDLCVEPYEMAPEIFSALSKVHGNDDADDNWEDFFFMLDDMRAHAAANGQAIVEEDRPLQLRLAFRCKNTQKTWSIRITNVKKSLKQEQDAGNASKADVFSRAIMTQEGKKSLVSVINGK
jgi:hypothetical protein